MGVRQIITNIFFAIEVLGVRTVLPPGQVLRWLVIMRVRLGQGKIHKHYNMLIQYIYSG